MKQYSISSEQASMAILAQQMKRMKIWETIGQMVHIQQKTVEHSPLEKLQDAFLNIISGGHGLVEINSRVRPNRVLQQLFGRQACADQSNVSRTLDRCTAENVQQLRSALLTLYVRHSRACQHDYRRAYQVLDVDFTGLLAGAQGELVTKGYFSDHPHQRGRQVGRGLATRYDEILSERLYAGSQQLASGLQQLVADAEVILNLQQPQRQRTLLRVDGGGGQDAEVNWLLARDYCLLVKMFSGNRARQLAQAVAEYHWIPDPQRPDRDVAWLPEPLSYARPTRQAAIRIRHKHHLYYGVLITNAPDSLLRELSRFSAVHPQAALLHMIYAYDRRSGGLETHNRGDKQGLGISKRNKRSALAQEMLILLAQLAHNLLIWFARRLKRYLPSTFHLGMLRLVRDVLSIHGLLLFDHRACLHSVLLDSAHPFANVVFRAFEPEWSSAHLSLYLHKF
jgi:X-X-X-Leu-X-X-Gly heptad repeat protein